MSSPPTSIPLQGRPNLTATVYESRDPTLLPNFGVTAFSGSTVNQTNPADFDVANPRVDAHATATIGGSETDGDTVTITVTHALLPTGSISASVTTAGGQTLASIAEALASGLNDAAEGLLGQIWFDAAAAVITAHWMGPVGNAAVLSRTLSAGATETVTFSPSNGHLAGGSGPIYPSSNFQYTYGGSILNFRYGIPFLADPGLITALINDGEFIV